MALVLIPESKFFAELRKRGFVETHHREGDMSVWNLGDEPYTLPLPIHKEDGHNLYCPFAIELFYKHAFGEESSVETNRHGDKDYNVVAIEQKPDSAA